MGTPVILATVNGEYTVESCETTNMSLGSDIEAYHQNGDNY